MGEKPRISFCQKYTATSIALVRPNAKYTSKNGRYILTRRVISRAISRIERYSPFLWCGILHALLISVNIQAAGRSRRGNFALASVQEAPIGGGVVSWLRACARRHGLAFELGSPDAAALYKAGFDARAAG